MQLAIGDVIRKAENIYITGNTTNSRYVHISQFETVNKIDAYLNSKHVSGETDSLGREKPFFNIVTAAANIWFRATDIDRKDIKLHPSKQADMTAAFLATIHLQDWMRRDNFGQLLNEWGRTLSRYGSAVVKFVEQDGKLHCIVVPWNRLITDTVDFDSNPVIEKIYLTPAQLLRRKGYDKDQVQKLIEATVARREIGKEKKDNKNDYIELYEIHGEMPLEFLTGLEKDRDTYVQQMQVVSFIAPKKKSDNYQDFALAKGKEAKSPYMITHLIKEDGRTLSIGAVENLFESQWMTNHTMKSMKDQLDLASKLIFQTADGNFVGQNALLAIEHGDILVHAPGMALETIPNQSHDITSLTSFAAQWQTLGNQINGISEAMLGTNPPSGTAWRQTEALLQESHSLFELMTENKGLAIEAMMRQFIIPFLKKQMGHSKEIAATLDAYGIQKVDSAYVPNEARRRGNDQLINTVLSGKMAQNYDPAQMEAQVQNELSQQGNTRFFKPSDLTDVQWADVFKDLEWNIEVETTGEDKDRANMLTTLSTVFKTIVANPAVLQDPNSKMVFNKILEITGALSPLELASQPAQPAQQNQPQPKVAESIAFKDLPPDGQTQMAAQAGIKIQAQPVAPTQTPQTNTINQPQ